MTYLRPDSKSQVTIEYDNDNNPIKIDAIVVSTQHDDFASEKEMLEQIKNDVIHILVPRVKSLLQRPLNNYLIMTLLTMLTQLEYLSLEDHMEIRAYGKKNYCRHLWR